MSDILISGYYGFKNSGDDAMLMSVINDLREQKQDIKISVLSSNPTETSRIYGVAAVNRVNIFEVLKAVRRTKMLVMGGGTLIQDSTSTKSLMYYLAILKIALVHKKKVMLYSNGIGPLSEKHRRTAARILNRIDVITLRDNASLAELNAMGVSKPKIFVTADSVMGLDTKNGKSALCTSGQRLLGISLREHKNADPDFEVKFAAAADKICEHYGLYPIFLPMQHDRDAEICRRVQRLMKHEADILEGELCVADMIKTISAFEIVIGMRLHSLIYSALNGVPSVGLAYDPKVKGVTEELGGKYSVELFPFSEEALIRAVDGCMAEYGEIKAAAEENICILRKKARKNAEYAIKLLGGDDIE